MNRRIVLIIGIVITFVVIGLIAYGILTSTPQKVTITFDNKEGGVTLSLYHAKDGTSTDTSGPAIQTITSNVPFSITKGVYIIKASGMNIDASPMSITVGDTPITKTFTVSYSTDYLSQLLDKNQTALTSLIFSKYPSVPSTYTLQEGRLFDQGEWYGTALVYKGSDTDNRDTLHLIAHLVNDQWSLATEPDITLNKIDYPNIPEDVLRQTNTYFSEPSTAPATPAPTYFIDNNAVGAQ